MYDFVLPSSRNIKFQNDKTYISVVLPNPPPSHGTVLGIEDTAVGMTIEWSWGILNQRWAWMVFLCIERTLPGNIRGTTPAVGFATN